MAKSITQLRADVGRNITGDPEFDGSIEAFAKLSPDDKISITNGMKKYIRENPDGYGENQVAVANTPDVAKLEDYTAADALDSFQEGLSEGASKVLDTTTKAYKTFILVATVVPLAVGLYQLNAILGKASTVKK